MFYKKSSLKDFQRASVLSAIAGNNVIVSASVGSGKSMIYLKLAEHLKIVVIQPLKALLEDQHKKYESAIVHGDINNKEEQFDKFSSSHNLLFITPESFNIYKHEIYYDILCIDEAHTILEYENFRPALKEVFESENNQVILLSGSFSNLDYDYYLSSRSFDIINETSTRDHIKFHYQYFDNFNGDVLSNFPLHQKTIIFVHRTLEVEYLKHSLRIQKSAFFHSKLSKTKKREILEQFISGEIQVIFSTSALSMGVDISDIRNVIHYDLPSSYSDFIQKNGRAGRDGLEANIFVLDSKIHVDKINQFLKDKDKVVDTYTSVVNTMTENFKK